MIGCIDPNRDISVYLQGEELPLLDKEVLEGVLIKIHKPKHQGKVLASVSASRYNENGFGIGVLDAGWGANDPTGKIELFISPGWYLRLIERGVVGLRYGQMGSKIALYDISRLEGLESIAVETLEFYRDNRDQLRPELG